VLERLQVPPFKHGFGAQWSISQFAPPYPLHAQL
jgi:hypothetical protein